MVPIQNCPVQRHCIPDIATGFAVEISFEAPYVTVILLLPYCSLILVKPVTRDVGNRPCVTSPTPPRNTPLLPPPVALFPSLAPGVVSLTHRLVPCSSLGLFAAVCVVSTNGASPQTPRTPQSLRKPRRPTKSQHLQAYTAYKASTPSNVYTQPVSGAEASEANLKKFREVRIFSGQTPFDRECASGFVALQGYLAHKKPRPPRTLR